MVPHSCSLLGCMCHPQFSLDKSSERPPSCLPCSMQTQPQSMQQVRGSRPDSLCCLVCGCSALLVVPAKAVLVADC